MRSSIVVEPLECEAEEAESPFPERPGLRFDPQLARVTAFLAGGAVDAAHFPWGALRPEDIAAIRQWANEAFAPPAAARLIGALRAALRHAVRQGEGDVLPPSGRRIRTGRQMPPGRRLAPREVRSLFQACALDESPMGARDAAIVALMLFGGLGRQDVASLNAADYEDDLPALRVGRRGRRRVARTLVLDGESRSLFEAWLERRSRGGKRLFPAVDRHGALKEGSGIGPAAVNRIVRRRGREAGLYALTPGDLRATFLAALRLQCRQPGAAPPVRFSREDDEPHLVMRTLIGYEANLSPAPPLAGERGGENWSPAR